MVNAKRKIVKAKRSSSKSKRARYETSTLRTSNPVNPTFGAVSTITTAPSAIGNSMSGFKTQVVPTADGIRVFGRDFAFSGAATGTVTTWVWTGGMPLTPACLPSTALRNMVQMYNKFKINGCMFHYITSSSTTTTGDVLFYYQKNVDSSMLEWTNNSFLPAVLSDSLTVIGPQWTNHTCVCQPKGAFKSCDYGASADQNEYSFGEIHLFSKTSSTESPGYIIFDYDITFKELSVNPRAGILPLARAQYQPIAITFTGLTAPTQDVTPVAGTTTGTTWVGGVTITAPVITAGDVYKLVIDSTNSTFSGKSTTTFFRTTSTSFTPTLTSVSNVTSVTLRDGFTCYAVATTSTSFQFYPTLTGALALSDVFYASTGTYAAEVLRGCIKLVSSVLPSTLQSSY